MYEKIIQNLQENHNSLKHYGIKDMHWGVRRFQNPDGSLTEEGRERYGVGEPRSPQFSDDFVKGVANLHRDPSELSTKEINDLISRLNAEQNLRNATKKKSAWRKLMEILKAYSDDIGTINTTYTNTKNAANNISSIIDALRGSKNKENNGSQSNDDIKKILNILNEMNGGNKKDKKDKK